VLANGLGGVFMARLQKPDPEIAALVQHIEASQAEAARAIEELKVRAGLAKGTREVTSRAAPTAQKTGERVVEMTLEQRIEELLRAASLDVRKLAKTLREQEPKVQAAVKKLAGSGQVANVGSVERPIWTWRLGDKTSTAELNQVVMRLISERPMTTEELASVTGARFARVGGSVVCIQQSPEFKERILDLGGGHGGVWFLLPENPRFAALEPRYKKKSRQGGGDQVVDGASPEDDGAAEP
jgi:hypothetical protein